MDSRSKASIRFCRFRSDSSFATIFLAVLATDEDVLSLEQIHFAFFSRASSDSFFTIFKGLLVRFGVTECLCREVLERAAREALPRQQKERGWWWLGPRRRGGGGNTCDGC